MNEVKWGEPPRPPHQRTGVDYAKVREELKSRPGEWAMVHEGERNGAIAVYMGLRRRGCNARTHNTGEQVQVWASWGDES